ncbi:MAG: HAMP domain-containing protein [bacterium]|nr:HAMP domain-containing protein [bacterium]
MPAKNRRPRSSFRFTIRIKLLLVTSVIVGAALSVMILMATRFFRDHSETLIQEYNLSLASLIGSRVESDLNDLASRSRLMAELLDEPGLSGERVSRYAENFFHENEHCVFLGVATGGDFTAGGEAGPLISLRHALANRDYDARGAHPADLIQSHAAVFAESFAGATLVRNITDSGGAPILAVSMPLASKITSGGANGGTTAGENDSADERPAALAGETPLAGDAPAVVLIALIQSGPLLEAFRQSGQTALFDIFMVDQAGQLIAHSDPEQLKTAGVDADFSQLPIVTNLLQNGSANGSRKYSHAGVDYLGSYRALDFGRLSVVSTIETDRAFEAVYVIRQRNLKIMAIVLLLAFLFVFFFSRTISRPISRLVRATRQIEQGDYHVTIKESTHDEVGLLTRSFARMAAGLEEKEKIKRTFGKFVNPEIVNRALQDEIKLGGENKVAAVLFSDLRNFTSMSENMRPDEIVALLNDYFTHMVDCVHDHHGVVDKYIGDALMAHWGAILSNGNDTENAVHAAIDMRNALAHVNERLGATGQDRLKIGCGINTGPVLAGQIGSEKRLEYTVIGDTVNLASRIEYLNKHFGTDILISEYAYRMVEGMFHVVQMPPIRIKGKSRAETVYAVLGRIDDPDCPASLFDLRERVGIEHDVEQARRQLEASSDQLVNEEALFASRPKKSAAEPGQ